MGWLLTLAATFLIAELIILACAWVFEGRAGLRCALSTIFGRV